MKKTVSPAAPQTHRRLYALILAASGFVVCALPVLADGTIAGTNISNTANATYEDPNAPGTTINATSNTVTVTVAEVAGITVTAAGVTDANGGQVQVGDQLQYTYSITNVGNDPTQFRIPNLANVTGPATVNGNLEVSQDGGTTWVPITGTEVVTTAIAPGGSILVRVPVQVSVGAQTNDTITVTLGDTPGDAQNQLRNPNGGDIYTVDNANGSVPNEVNGAPVNGVREASVTQQVQVASTLKTYALATVLKNRSAYNNASTPAINDDTLTYDLGLRVESTDPTGNGITPAPLVGNDLSVDGVTRSQILISDAIPAGTNLAVAPSAPPGWQVVYSVDPVTVNANAAAWTTIAPATLSNVTRVGFINNPAVVTAVAPGSTVSGFSLQLKVVATTAPLTVANVAQVFGKTPGTNVPVYDESGDQRPSNYDGSNPPAGTDTNNDGVPDTPPTPTDGYINDSADLTATGNDPGNNNGGTGPNGEANVFVVDSPVASSLQNGPEGAPEAIGPSSVNDDFTNKSALILPDIAPSSTVNPAPVAFTNTLKNNGTDAGVLTLAPKAPTNPADLPANTTVTITYGADSVSYVYNLATGFTITSSTVGLNQPITIVNFDPNEVINYGVEVNLPAGTPLSTDALASDPEKGFPVTIVAAIDNYTTDSNNDGIKDAGNDGTANATNETIDRVYTGFLKMVKESRLLPGTGPAPLAADTTFSLNSKTPAPGNIIEYRITYTNISEAQAGTGNILLNANNVKVVEDGTVSTVAGDGKNNWALDNDGDGKIDTSNIVGSARDSGASTITFFNGRPATTGSPDQTGTTVSTDVTRYVNTVTGLVSPGESRTFMFQRKMN
jgi:hypothetical protein